MLSQSVWDQMLESEKQKVRELENKYAELMKAANVRLFSSFGVLFYKVPPTHCFICFVVDSWQNQSCL